jgi:hypothetical protein
MRGVKYIRPIPVPPPVTRQTKPFTENSFSAAKFPVEAILEACSSLYLVE